MTAKVQVPREIYDSLTALAGSGSALPDYRAMKELAGRHGCQTAEHWLHNNMKLYHQIRLSGMEPAE